MKIIDTHCHPHFSKYDSDREEMILRAQKTRVGMIGVGVDLESSQKEIEIAEKYSSPPPIGYGVAMWASVGLHPNDNEREISENSKLINLAYAKIISHPKVVAVGEVGLDYYRTPEPEKQARQRETFKQFIELAVEHDKPLIIHCRNSAKLSDDNHGASAHADMITILSGARPAAAKPLCGVIHSFTGTYEDAKKYIEMGFMIGLNGIITFARQYDETVKNIPLDKILLETDAPFLAPETQRGKRNEPAYIVEVAKKIAELRGVSFEEVCKQTTQNGRRLFKI